MASRLRVGNQALVDVAIVPVDHSDLGAIAVNPAEPICGQGTSGATADDHDPRAHTTILVRRVRRIIRSIPQSAIG